MAQKNFLALSDEDFLNQLPPSTNPETEDEPDDSSDVTEEDAVEAPVEEKSNADPASGSIDPGTSVANDGDDADNSSDASDAGDEDDKSEKSASELETGNKEPKVPDTTVDPVAKTSPDASSQEPVTEVPNPSVPKTLDELNAFYKQIMAPFKANGRMVEPRTPDEAIRLMQMGAGFGRKLQDMQPHLKSLRMLEKHDLLDENKLSFLIDLQNKNPEAIKKLIKESGIDPLDLNMEDTTSYVPSNHSVTDAEASFQEAITEVQSQPGGGQTIQIINQTWDAQSKNLLWEEPALLGVIQTQRETGLYDLITKEMDRQKIFGTIPANTPFIKAYQLAGEALQAAGALPKPAENPAPSSTSVVKTVPQVIATRTDKPKSGVTNNDKAKAASPSPTTTRKAATLTNPLEMADDEFLKQFKDRF